MRHYFECNGLWHFTSKYFEMQPYFTFPELLGLRPPCARQLVAVAAAGLLYSTVRKFSAEAGEKLGYGVICGLCDDLISNTPQFGNFKKAWKRHVHFGAVEMRQIASCGA
mmetsp:Transcript_141607/g.271889  ORF Transcript_141607/g.271889 Transcript_141607/m.271889 type:complete len:110 (-) Transcript_141607:56-385(-)